MLDNVKRWPGILNSGQRAFVTFLGLEALILIIAFRDELRPDWILFNLPRSQWWAILALVGVIAFILYGASKDKGELEKKIKGLEAQSPGDSPDRPIEPTATVFIEPYSNDSPGGIGTIRHGTRGRDQRALPLRLLLSASGPVLLEQLELEISGQRLASGWESDWLSVGVTTDADVDFLLTDKVSRGSHKVRVLGYAGGKWFASERFDAAVP